LIAAAGDQQHPDRFAVAALTGLGEVLAGQRFAGGADRVELVRLRAVAPRRARWAVDLDDPLAPLEQEGGQTGAEAAARLDRPHAPRAGGALREAQQPLERDGVGRRLGRGDHHAGGGHHDRGGVRVAVRVDTNDVLDPVCEHAHARPPRG
jgi:hypothetical protein